SPPPPPSPRAPPQRKTLAPAPFLPTAHTSFAPVAGPPHNLADHGTLRRRHELPFQCSITAAPVLVKPIAHTSALPMAATSRSVPSNRAAAARVHAVPSQCSISGL